MGLRLNETGRLATFYKWSFGETKLPSNLCPFFWLMIFAVVIFPLNGSARLLIGLTTKFPFLLRLSPILMGVVGLGALIFLIITDFTALMLILCGMIAGIGVVSILIGILEYAMFLSSNKEKQVKEDKTTLRSEIADVLREQRLSFKEKYCPRIDWN